MKGVITAQSARCIGSWRHRTRPGSAATSACILSMPSPSCSQFDPTRCGRGIYRSSRARAKWSCFHLYVILDIFSRYVVGWMVAQRESAELAEQPIADTLEKENIAPGTLTLHADRGTSMRSKPVAALLIDLEVAKTHSRPHVSDDNPYSEAQFKTLKYRPDFPDRFGSIEDARAHCQSFFRWYNHEHRHGGIGLMAPAAVHDGTAAAMTAQRAITLDAAFAAHPIRFKGIAPKPPALPTAAWINPPKKESTTPAITPTCSLIS